LDVKVIKFSALESAWTQARLPSEREHVTPFVKKSDDFRCGSFRSSRDLSSLRWTVDEPEDLVLVEGIHEALLPIKPEFGIQDVLEYIDEHPEVTRLNAHIAWDKGYARSVRDDVAYKERP
jgi:spore coat polysaccharide biosynthesis protein SpsF (cytidylyltransferase family)